MVDITHKSNSLRIALASATITVSKPETIDAINNRTVPKGDVFEFSRAAGLLAIKKTSEVIPDCHPLPVESASIRHELDGLSVKIFVEVKTIYKTGVEVEAMHGAAITALTMYDMLKPLDKGVEISNIRLENKTGGKTDFASQDPASLKAAVVICSDSVTRQNKEDKTGKMIVEKLAGFGITVQTLEAIPDEFDAVQEKGRVLSSHGYDLILFAGGTGLSDRDITPDAIAPLITREIPGVMETARQYGQQRMPYAMLSRGICGFIGSSLVLTMPGSPKGSAETIDAVFPYLLHVFKVAKGLQHD